MTTAFSFPKTINVLDNAIIDILMTPKDNNAVRSAILAAIDPFLTRGNMTSNSNACPIDATRRKPLTRTSRAFCFQDRFAKDPNRDIKLLKYRFSIPEPNIFRGGSQTIPCLFSLFFSRKTFTNLSILSLSSFACSGSSELTVTKSMKSIETNISRKVTN